MRRAVGVAFFALVFASGRASAGNNDDVVAGTDVALTGGAVVANVHTGGAMWFNPAGVARLDSRAVGLTGSVISYNIARAPGLLSIENGEQSEGDFAAVTAIPRALTFVASPRPELRWGIGLFFSRSLSRFFQDSVATAADAAEPSEFYATTDESKSLYHISSALAWKKSDKFLLGGGLDLVIASQWLTEIISGAYDGGDGGTFNRSLNKALSGGGLQMKLGLQWAPIRQLRIGWMVATPSYLFVLSERLTVTQQLASPGGAPEFSGTQTQQTSGTWSGVERGLTRAGLAYIGKWGWVEADLIVGFPLRTPVFDIDWKTTADVRVGTIVRISRKVRMGGGFSTNFSPENAPNQFADSEVDYYNFTIGVDYANRRKPPERGEEGVYIAFAAAFRYSYGTGRIAGLRFPSELPDPPAQPGQLNAIDIKTHSFGINLALKAGF